MAEPLTHPPSLHNPQIQKISTSNWHEFPWWLVAIFAFLIGMALLIILKPGPRLLIRIDDAKEIEDLNDVVKDEELITGVLSNSPEQETALEYLSNDRIQLFSQPEDAVQALIAGDIDVFISDKKTAQQFVDENEARLISVTAFTNYYNDAFGFIVPGIRITLYTTLTAFGIALVLGLLAGLGRVSRNVVLRNTAVTYIEFIRGVPTLVLIFTLALVIIPAAVDSINLFVEWLVAKSGLEQLQFLSINARNISNNSRTITALAIIYGGFLAEIFRAGIESISKGQMEAARSLGMTMRQAMQHIILPQAIRNIAPALGNDFIAMLKDSSLVSILAVRDITQRARLHAGSSFRFRESYLVLTFLYLAMTIALSLLLRWYERRLKQGAR